MPRASRTAATLACAGLTLTATGATAAATTAGRHSRLAATVSGPTRSDSGARDTFLLGRTLPAGDQLRGWSVSFGDGTRRTGKGTPPRRLAHTFAAAGTYTVRFRITDAAHRISRAGFVVTVSAPAPAVAPTSAPTQTVTQVPTPDPTTATPDLSDSPAVATSPPSPTAGPTAGPTASTDDGYVSVTGQVIDARTGAALVHVPVEVSSYCNCAVTPTSTDTAGDYRLEVPATSFYDSHGRAVPVTITADGQPAAAETYPAGAARDDRYQPGYAGATAAGDGTYTANLALTSGVSLTGLITDGQGRGVDGSFRISVVETKETFVFTATSGADGRFVLHGLPPGVSDESVFTPVTSRLRPWSGTCDTTSGDVTLTETLQPS